MTLFMYVGKTNRRALEMEAGFRSDELMREIPAFGTELMQMIVDKYDREDCVCALLDLPEGAQMFVSQTVEEGESWFISHINDDYLRRSYDSCRTIFSWLRDNKDNEYLAVVLRNNILSLLDCDARDYLSSMTKEWIRSELFVECDENGD